jgi:hypothetical protein
MMERRAAVAEGIINNGKRRQFCTSAFNICHVFIIYAVNLPVHRFITPWQHYDIIYSTPHALLEVSASTNLEYAPGASNTLLTLKI